MGKLGFIFNIADKRNMIFLNDKVLEKSKVVVFIEKENIRRDYIVGLDQFFNEDECEFLYLSKDLSLNSFLVFNKSKFIYGKVSLYEKTEVDFEGVTFWFHITKYKMLWDFLTLDIEKNIDEEISKRVVKISEFFQ